jgi:hypothetical protein
MTVRLGRHRATFDTSRTTLKGLGFSLDDGPSRTGTGSGAHGDLAPTEFAGTWTSHQPQAAERLDHSTS